MENENKAQKFETMFYCFVRTINDRFWRKTRSRGRYYHGVDPNRNFDYKWNGVGSSRIERSPVYAGKQPFSEPETKAISKMILKNCSHIKLYVTMHSARKCLLYPFGFTKRLPGNIEQLHELAVDVQNTINLVNGNDYKVGNALSILKPTSGTSHDWAYGKAGIDLCYALELPGGGTRGFDLPESDILQVVREVFEGFRVFHDYVQDEYSN